MKACLSLSGCEGTRMKKLLVLLIALYSPLGFSAGYLTPLGQGLEIQKIHAHNGGGLTIWIDSKDNLNPDNCNDPQKVHIRSTNPGLQNMMALVMTAYATGKKIGLWSPKCETIPFWGGTQTRAIINDLWITD